MNIDNMTIGEAKEIVSMFGSQGTLPERSLQGMVGTKCIIRTHSAGVWFGNIAEKSGNEVIVENARRLWYWKANKSVSLSAVAQYGLSDASKVAPTVEKVWLEAIELIPVGDVVATNIEGQPDVQAG